MSFFQNVWRGRFLLGPSTSSPPLKTGAFEGIGIFLINLERSPERLAAVHPLLEQMSFPIYRVVGIDGADLNAQALSVDFQTYRWLFGKKIGPGTLGCAYSHLKAWQAFLDSSHAFALICEDDIDFSPPLLASLLKELTLTSFWDICGFQGNHWGAPLPLCPVSHHQVVVYLFPVTGAACYLLTRKGAEKLQGKALPIRMPVDHYFTRTWEFPLRFIGVHPRPVTTHGASEIDQRTRETRLSLSFKERWIRRAWTVMGSLWTFATHLRFFLVFHGRRWQEKFLKLFKRFFSLL